MFPTSSATHLLLTSGKPGDSPQFYNEFRNNSRIYAIRVFTIVKMYLSCSDGILYLLSKKYI